MNKGLVPRLRFKGFNNEWNNKKISSLSSIHARIGWQNLRTSEFLNNGNYLLITGTDFNNGKINFDKCYYVKKGRYDQDKNIQVRNGNILITKDGTLGKVAMVKGLNMPATLNAGVFNINVNSELIDSNYLFQFLKAPFLMKYVKQHSTGGTISHLNQSVLVNFPVQLPSLMEQQHIGAFFAKLDRMIELQSKKITHLKQLKKGYLQKMFSQKGENVPRLRFDGFRDEWNEKKIINLLNYEQPTKYIINSDKYINKGIPVLTANHSFILGYTNENNIYDKGNCIIFDDFTENFKYVDFPFKVKSSALKILTAKEEFNIYFIYNLLKTTHLIHEGHSRHYISNVQNHKVNVPFIQEQNKIGQFFKHLDQSINEQKNKLNQLKRLKKAYLQKMFI